MPCSRIALRLFLGCLVSFMLFGCGGPAEEMTLTEITKPTAFVGTYPKPEPVGGSEYYNSHSVELPIEEGQPGSFQNRISIHIPKESPDYDTTTVSGKYPVLFICPGGGTAFSGVKLKGSSFTVDNLSNSGFVVVRYGADGLAIFGNAPNSEKQVREAIQRYNGSQAGLQNALNAIEYTLQNVPEADPNRMFAVGHSSGGRQALLLACFDDRIRGVLAYAPETRVDSSELVELRKLLPGLPENLEQVVDSYMPATHGGELNCPVRIFHGKNDQIVPLKDSELFVADLKSRGIDAELVATDKDHKGVISVATGDDYKWLISLQK